MRRYALLFILLVLCAGFVFSYDFGLLLVQKFEAENKYLTYTPAFIPWFSWNGGQGLSVYLSGSFSAEYNYSDDNIDSNDGWIKPVIRPELSSFSISYRNGYISGIEAGRIWYNDALGVTASGLFDGVHFERSLAAGSISANLFYTGFLYKETAKILMTDSDWNAYFKPVDTVSDYFASRRLFAGGRWDMPLMEIHTLSIEALAQFDLNGGSNSYNSQYAEVRMDFYTAHKLGITGGFIFEAIQSGDDDFSAGLGALAVLMMDMPGPLKNGLKLTAKFSSGAWNDTLIAFTPISYVSQGAVFSEPFSGLFLFRADYDARILPSLFAEGNLSYFARTQSEPGEDGNLLGAEIWASLAWQPYDDLRANLGFGAFLPGMGNANPNNDTMWKFHVGISFSL